MELTKQQVRADGTDSDSEKQHAAQKRMKGTWSDILCCFFLLVFPLLGINILIIVLIAGNLEPGSLTSTSMLVNISATTLTTFTSWSSTVAPLLGSFMVILASYPASRRMLLAGRSTRSAGLPTAYQLALIIEIRAGAVFGALWRWYKYKTSFKKPRSPLAPATALILCSFLLGLLLSAAVFVADTWLHLSTTSVTITRYSPSPGTNLSFVLARECLHHNNSVTEQIMDYSICRLATKPYAWHAKGDMLPIAVLSNTSNLVVTKSHAVNDRTYAYLSPADTTRNLGQDYNTTTYAASSKCEPWTSKCRVSHIYNDSGGISLPFNCTGQGFSGSEIATPLPKMKYFANGSMTSVQDFKLGFSNPFHSLAAATIPLYWKAPEKDPEFTDSVDGFSFIMHCATTVYDVAYSMRGGLITAYSAVPSNQSVAIAVVPGTLGLNGILAAFQLALAPAAATSDSAAELLAKWAVDFDRALMAMAAPMLEPAPASGGAWNCTEALAARVPVAPLACLLAANTLYAVVGLVLAGWAARALAAEPEAGELVQRATVAGLVAERFGGETATRAVESVEDLFVGRDGGDGATESRVRLVRVYGAGYRYETLE